MRKLIPILALTLIFSEAEANNCLKCHRRIENIVPPESKMAKALKAVAKRIGYPDNTCIVCHGGNPEGKTEKEAHSGTVEALKKIGGAEDFYPDPGSPWINKHTCGLCHRFEVKVQKTSLMFTEVGKIQGALWAFGGLEGYNHRVANYKVKSGKLYGTDEYRKYVEELKKAEPQLFPEETVPVPKAPKAEEVEKDVRKAVYTYLREECLRCHTGVKGRTKRGDYRGMGCSACHVPYSNEGYYEGKDPTIPKDKPGYPLVHELQGTRSLKVRVHGITYSGIPVETCNSCHNRGKRIGVSYEGLMESPYGSPYSEDGSMQPKLHTKRYIHLHPDVHYEKGMTCQDCHTTLDIHGNGIVAGTNLAAVEVECQDCHGTVDKFPWELPLGYGDELEGNYRKPRGVVFKLPDYMKFGKVYKPEDGYLLTSRGNPFGNVVRRGNLVVVHTAGGKDLILKPLKLLYEEGKIPKEALVAMKFVKGHGKLECYTCHSDWAPQCYGCHVRIDYSKGKKHCNWLSKGEEHLKNGLEGKGKKIDGEVKETRSYLRWENPPLVVNGEHRVSPAIPGCQTVITVIGKDGKPIILNHIFRVPDAEGAGKEGQRTIDIAPVQPHTVSKRARSCESCHNNPVAMGYGISGGRLMAPPDKPYVVDIKTQDGRVVPERARVQINAIPDLPSDWSRFVTETGKQLQTVGHHFKGSRPLNSRERALLDRRGVCLACHKKPFPQVEPAGFLLDHLEKVFKLKR